jgi:hypothetical protein
MANPSSCVTVKSTFHDTFFFSWESPPRLDVPSPFQVQDERVRYDEQVTQFVEHLEKMKVERKVMICIAQEGFYNRPVLAFLETGPFFIRISFSICLLSF